MSEQTPVKAERNAAIAECRAAGMTILAISRRFGVSEARVGQILKAAGVLNARPVRVNLPAEFPSISQAAAAYGVKRDTIYRWIGRGIVSTTAALLLVACCGGAEAQQRMPCAKLAEIAAGLAERYREKPVATGLQANGQLLEIFASPDGSTWTALTTSPAGLACVVATGKSWQQGAAGEPT